LQQDDNQELNTGSKLPNSIKASTKSVFLFAGNLNVERRARRPIHSNVTRQR
jgi:hypothetical protein